MIDNNTESEGVQMHNSILVDILIVDILINEAVKLLTDAECGYLPHIYAVGRLIKEAAARVRARPLDLMAAKQELEEARERITTFVETETGGPVEPIYPVALIYEDVKQECIVSWYHAANVYYGVPTKLPGWAAAKLS
jgi:hypothetical protein